MELFAGSELVGAQAQVAPLAAGAGLGADGAFFAFFAALPPAPPEGLLPVAAAPAGSRSTAPPLPGAMPQDVPPAPEGPASRFAALTTAWPEAPTAADPAAAAEAEASPDKRAPASRTRAKAPDHAADTQPDAATAALPAAAAPPPSAAATLFAAPAVAPAAPPQGAPGRERATLPATATAHRAAPTGAEPAFAAIAVSLPTRETPPRSGSKPPLADTTPGSAAAAPSTPQPGAAGAEQGVIAGQRAAAASPAVWDNGPATVPASFAAAQQVSRPAPPDEAHLNPPLAGEVRAQGRAPLADTRDPLGSLASSDRRSGNYRVAAGAAAAGDHARPGSLSATQIRSEPSAPVHELPPAPPATPSQEAPPGLHRVIGPGAEAPPGQPAIDRAPAVGGVGAGAAAAAVVAATPIQQAEATREQVDPAFDGARLRELPKPYAGPGSAAAVQPTAAELAPTPPAAIATPAPHPGPETPPRSPRPIPAAADVVSTTPARTAAAGPLPREPADKTASLPADPAAPDAMPAPVSDSWQRPGQAGANQPAATSAAHQPADVAVSVVRQLAESLAHTPDRSIELTLAPEELGRVRLTLASSDLGVSVSVHAERPETLDLIRRNIDHLARDFRELGYTNIAFSFGDRSQQGQPEAAPQQPDPDPAPPALRPVPDRAHQPGSRAMPESGGLDLRL